MHQINSSNTSETQNQKQDGGACGDGRPDNKQSRLRKNSSQNSSNRQGRLQKKDSQNSEASESSDEDYHKMTAGGVGNNCDNTQASDISQQKTNAEEEISAQGQQTRALPPKPTETQGVESQKEMSKSKTEQTTLSNISGKTSNQSNRSGFEYEPNQSKHFINECDVKVTEECLGKVYVTKYHIYSAVRQGFSLS